MHGRKYVLWKLFRTCFEMNKLVRSLNQGPQRRTRRVRKRIRCRVFSPVSLIRNGCRFRSPQECTLQTTFIGLRQRGVPIAFTVSQDCRLNRLREKMFSRKKLSCKYSSEVPRYEKYGTIYRTKLKATGDSREVVTVASI